MCVCVFVDGCELLKSFFTVSPCMLLDKSSIVHGSVTADRAGHLRYFRLKSLFSVKRFVFNRKAQVASFENAKLFGHDCKNNLLLVTNDC